MQFRALHIRKIKLLLRFHSYHYGRHQSAELTTHLPWNGQWWLTTKANRWLLPFFCVNKSSFTQHEIDFLMKKIGEICIQKVQLKKKLFWFQWKILQIFFWNTKIQNKILNLNYFSKFKFDKYSMKYKNIPFYIAFR